MTSLTPAPAWKSPVLVKTAGERASEPAKLLRHATGIYLANAGQDTRAIQSEPRTSS